jgi:hypothetical protein
VVNPRVCGSKSVRVVVKEAVVCRGQLSYAAGEGSRSGLMSHDGLQGGFYRSR